MTDLEPGTVMMARERGLAGIATGVTPSKNAQEENFPVGSWLLPKHLRSHVAAFYRFARDADDIADSPDLSRDQKLGRLSAMREALTRGGHESVDPIRESAARTGVGLEECADLLVAFTRDAENLCCDSWADLIDYCRYSAHPVGRYLLRLHGESPDTYQPGDALCAAFQILNHLQDCGDDRRNLARIYVPRHWIDAAGGEDLFFSVGAADRRRPVLYRCLDGADRLIETASLLPGLLQSTGLRAEVQVMLRLVRTLSRKLREGDPIQARVALAKTDFIGALLPGLMTLARLPVSQPSDEQIVLEAVSRAGSSFTAGMRILPPARRRGMYALYGFCRAVDDIADAPAPEAEKRTELKRWADALDKIYSEQGENALERELVWAVRTYRLPRDEFDLVLDGMLIDAGPSVRIADRTALAAYARRVAGAVGVLSCRIFGVDGDAADAFAIYLGETLQLTNILRDVDEDAEIDRLYLPMAMVEAAGITATFSARDIVKDPRLETVCAALAREVEERYAALPQLMPKRYRRELRSARLMQMGYAGVFRKLLARGWARRGPRPRLTKGEALRALVTVYSS